MKKLRSALKNCQVAKNKGLHSDWLFIDEPTVGMDVQSRKQFWNKIHELAARGKTILFSTHYLQEADDIASRIILFSKGKIVADGTPENIKNKLTKQSVSFTTD